MMQTDVKAKNLTATGASSIGPRARIKAVCYVAGALAGSISFRDGSASGVELLKLDTPGSAGAVTVLIPGQGVLFQGDPYVTLTNATSVTYFYG